MSHVGNAFRRIITPHHTFVTEQDLPSLVKAAERDNEEAGGCCSGPGTKGSERLRDLFLKPETQNRFKDMGVRTQLSAYLKLDHQGASKDMLETAIPKK
jgi:hypothetical protein